VFIAYAVIGSLSIFIEEFTGEEPAQKQQVFTQIGISVFLYAVVIIIPFVIKKPKTVSYVLFGLAVATLISAGGFGIIGFAILIAAGIAAIRWKEKPIQQERSALDVLKERYAKGEIATEEFQERKAKLKEESQTHEEEKQSEVNFVSNSSIIIPPRGSRWWYLLPIFFSIIGGIIAYFILKNDDPKLAKDCILIGALTFGIFFVIGFMVGIS